MFLGMDILFHPRHDSVFLFAYNTKLTVEFILSGKLGPGFFKQKIPPHTHTLKIKVAP